MSDPDSAPRESLEGFDPEPVGLQAPQETKNHNPEDTGKNVQPHGIPPYAGGIERGCFFVSFGLVCLFLFLWSVISIALLSVYQGLRKSRVDPQAARIEEVVK